MEHSSTLNFTYLYVLYFMTYSTVWLLFVSMECMQICKYVSIGIDIKIHNASFLFVWGNVLSSLGFISNGLIALMSVLELSVTASDILIEFLEVAVHNILYIRNIYPTSIFVRRKKYGVPVQMSIHPYLNEYITECLKTIRDLLQKNEVRKVTVTFFNETQRAIERFVFDILDLNRTLNQ